MKINAATQLTLLRLILIPIFLVFVLQEFWVLRVIALFIFVAASLTDYYDGRLARSRGMVTRMGTFLDPLADKLLIVSAFVVFVQCKEIHVPAWMVVLIIGREFLITGLRTLAVSEGRVIAAQPAGKFKTTSQMVVIITTLVLLIVHALIARYGWGSILWWAHHSGFWRFIRWILNWGPYWLTLGVTILTVVSGTIYIMANVDLFHEKSQPGR